jgi:hypothetical protein
MITLNKKLTEKAPTTNMGFMPLGPEQHFSQAKESATQQALAVSGNCTATAGDFKLPTFFF